MSDEMKAPRLVIGSMWRLAGNGRIVKVVGLNDCGYRAQATTEPVHTYDNRKPKEFYRLASDDDLFATDTCEDEPDPVARLRADAADARDDSPAEVSPKHPGQHIEIGLKVDVSHLVKHLNQLDGYIKGYKDAIEGKPAYLKMEETTPCDE